MSEQANMELMRRLYAAYAERNPQPMIAALADDCVYYSMEPSRLVRFGSAYHGKAGFIQALTDIAADWELVAYHPARLLADGDHVIALSDVAFRHRATGALVEIDKVDVWRLADGRIVQFNEYYDTLKVDRIVSRAARPKAKPRAQAKRAKSKPAKRAKPKRAAPKRAKRAAAKSNKRRATRRRR